ncbi:cupin 2 domain-containing [Fusarium acutatum]|uniref:Cupin 2 domain-containing n=1 Tax=Fusarium acutatum TaxID=78861 RepID=A0A8H4NLK3_9HYPO|nr:cupin 2 domain-containing [Fusarium acutatum]
MATTTQIVTTMANTSNKGELKERADQAAVPYRGPRLPAVPDDLVLPGIFDFECDERLWVPQAPDFGFYLFFSPFLAATLSTFFESGDLGRWHYLEHLWWATEGGYAFEPLGDIHTLEVPGDVKEMVTMFHVTGAYIYVDADGNPVGVEDVFSKLDKARKHYEAIGLGASFADQFMR